MMVWALCGRAFAGFGDDGFILARGDANDDGAVNVSDAVYINQFFYYSGPRPPCMNQADVDHNGSVTGTDSAFLLNFLFNGGSAPPSPGPYATTCSVSQSPIISCISGC